MADRRSGCGCARSGWVPLPGLGRRYRVDHAAKFDCECNCGMTCCADEPDAADHAIALKEAQDDAKIADERAEWYGKVAEGAIADRDKALRDAAYYKQIADSRLDAAATVSSDVGNSADAQPPLRPLAPKPAVSDSSTTIESDGSALAR